MANRRDDNVKNPTVEILEQIRGELTGLREEQKAGFKELRDRFDNLLERSGGRYRDHERRIRALERHAPPRRGT